MSAPRDIARMELGLVFVSAAALMLEVLQTRIFAFSLDPLTMYLAVGICLLGLGAAATVLALVPPLAPGRARTVAAASAALAAIAIVASHVVFAHRSDDLLASGARAVPTLLALTVPYFALGIAITLVFAARADALGRVYAANLAGSALGCLLVFPVLDALGAERGLVIVCALTVAGALLLARLRGMSALGAAAGTAVILVAAARVAPALLPFRPDPNGQLSMLQRRAAQLTLQRGPGAATTTPMLARWDRTARVDVYKLDSVDPELRGAPIDSLLFVQDASAGSMLLGVGDEIGRARELFEHTVYGLAYARGGAGDVLVIGLGGAPDVQSALYHGARHVDAVEINRSTIDIVRRDFRGYLGDPYAQPGVVVHQVDGRTFLRQTDATYDVIQMTGVDTKSIFASGSLSVNQHYVYTQEAMREVLRHLRPDGVFVINVFSDLSLSRLAATAVAALTDLGATAPSEHLFAVHQAQWHGLLVKRSPLTPAEVRALHAWAERAGPAGPDIVVPTYDWVGVTFRAPMSILYSPGPEPRAESPLFAAIAEGRLDAMLASVASHGADLYPVRDDRPFFFFLQTPSYALRRPGPALLAIYRLLGWLVLISTASIVVPLFVWRRRGLRMPHAPLTLAYFASLGAGFMLVEIGLIQRFVLLLGHQSYAISVVLTGLLLGAGAGSLVSTALPATWRAPLIRVLGILIGVILAYALFLPPVFDAAARSSFVARLGLGMALLLVLGFLLGMPFPAGLRALDAVGPSLVPWAIGINGFASVVGATLAIPLAMLFGLRALLFLGASLYAVVVLTAPVAPDPRADVR